jgi:hypothetical protein
MSVLGGSNVLASWARYIGGAVGRGGSNKLGQAEDILSAIAGGGGGSGAVASAQGGQQWQASKPLPPPLLAS